MAIAKIWQGLHDTVGTMTRLGAVIQSLSPNSTPLINSLTEQAAALQAEIAAELATPTTSSTVTLQEQVTALEAEINSLKAAGK